MAAKIFVSWNVITTSDVILVAREKDAPLAEVFRQFYAAPHTQVNLTISPVNPVMHIIQIWKTTDGATLEVLMGQCDIDASLNTEEAFSIITFIVNRGLTGAPNYDPVTPTDQYVNPDLDGKTYLVFKPGYGPLIFGYHIQTIAGGGFKYINGDSFSDTEEFTVLVSDLVGTAAPATNGGYPRGIVDISANRNFAPTDYNMLLEASGSANVVLTIVDIDTIPEGTVFGINTHNSTCKYLALVLPSGKYCQVAGKQRNIVYIGEAEEVEFIKKGAYLRIVNWDGDYKRLGQRVYTDSVRPPNGIPEVGGWLLKTDYPRAWNWYVNELPGSEVIAGVDDVTPAAGNIAKWGAGTLKFWVPDTGGYFIRNVDPDSNVDTGRSIIPGDIQADTVGPHTHNVTPPDSNSDSGFGKTATGNDSHEGSGIAAYRTATNDSTGSANETRVKNVNSYSYRIG